MTRAEAVAVFLAFAFTYFFSALLRAVTATLAPAFSSELGLQAADLGLLAGAYFFGFAAMQLPLGRALDRFGPRRTIMALLLLAVLGCALFAQAHSLPALIAARALIGVGVGACLMAPLTCFRRWYSPAAQLRANSWMLMSGSLGMVASTLPVQLLLPLIGWRGLFWAVAAMLLVCIGLIGWRVPRDAPAAAAGPDGGYREILRHPLFLRMAPLGFFLYGGLIAVQSLWAGPWLTRVGGATPAGAAQGLFAINLCMLFTFMAWGAAMPRLARRGLGAVPLMTWGVPVSLALLALNILLGPAAGPAHWALWCVSCTVVSLSQPAVGQAFPAHLAGRALSAFNLVIFGGVFCTQWGIGIAVDALKAAGRDEVQAFRWAFAGFGAGCVAAYVAFIAAARVRADNARQDPASTVVMPAILVVCHAPLASALKAVAEHVYPDCGRQLAAVDVGPGATPEQVAVQVREARAHLGAAETLILTDMFGATPCNGARSVADGTAVRVVAGVNVPMLWRTLCYGQLSLAELVQRALDGGAQGVMHVPPEARRQNQSNPPGFHEQDNDPHQQ